MFMITNRKMEALVSNVFESESEAAEYAQETLGLPEGGDWTVTERKYVVGEAEPELTVQHFVDGEEQNVEDAMVGTYYEDHAQFVTDSGLVIRVFWSDLPALVRAALDPATSHQGETCDKDGESYDIRAELLKVLSESKKPIVVTEEDLKRRKDALLDQLAELTKMELELEATKINHEVPLPDGDGTTAEDLLENMEEDRTSPTSPLTDLFARMRRLFELEQKAREMKHRGGPITGVDRTNLWHDGDANR